MRLGESAATNANRRTPWHPDSTWCSALCDWSTPNGGHAAVGTLVKDRSKSQPPIGRPEWLVGKVLQSGYPKLVISRRGCDRCGRWWLATCFAQQQQQGYRSERDQHHQLEIIDIGDHCGLPRHLG